MSHRRLAVVGGGIAGLAAAWEAVHAGNEVTLFEQSPRVGGKLATTSLATPSGVLSVDAGAEAFLARRPEVGVLAAEVGLGGDVVVPATTAARVWSRGGLHPLPAGTVLGVPGSLTGLTGLLSDAEVARVAAEASLPPLTRADTEPDVAVGELVAARLGDAVVDRLVEPLLGGVYAWRARELSLAAVAPGLLTALRATPGGGSATGSGATLLGAVAAAAGRSAGSLTAVGPVFAGIRGGVGRLPGAVADALTAAGARVRTGAAVRALARSGPGWRLWTGSAAAEDSSDYDAVILATPAPATARLLDSAGLVEAAAVVRTVDYASLGIVLLSLRSSADLDRAVGGTSGILVPPVEGRTIKAATWSSTKWGWLADGPPGGVLLRASVGRHGEHATLARPDTAVVRDVLTDLSAVLDVDLTPQVVEAQVRRWGGALPQYAPGHLDLVASVRAAVATAPGLAVCGAAWDGVGIPACIAGGRLAARQLT